MFLKNMIAPQSDWLKNLGQPTGISKGITELISKKISEGVLLVILERMHQIISCKKPNQAYNGILADSLKCG